MKRKLQRDKRNGTYFVWIRRQKASLYFNLGKSEREARRRLKQVEADVEAGRIAFSEQTTRTEGPDGSGDMNLKELAVRHLQFVRDGKSPATFRLRQHYVSLFVERVGARAVSQVTNEAIEDFLRWVRGRRGRDCSGRHAVEEVKAMFRWGQDRGHCRNPVKAWPRIAREPPATKDFSDEDIRRLLGAVPEELADLVRLVMQVGLRPQEARALAAGHVVRREGKAVALRIEHHKTSKFSRVPRPRSVPLTPATAAIVERRLRQAPPSGHLFVNADGVPYTARTLRQRLRRACARAGIAPRPTYALRHVFGCRQGLLKVNLAVIAGLMGHSNVRTTTRYLLNVDEASCNAVAELGDYFDRALGKAAHEPLRPSSEAANGEAAAGDSEGVSAPSGGAAAAQDAKSMQELPPKLPRTKTAASAREQTGVATRCG